jgi:hypothetical protein
MSVPALGDSIKRTSDALKRGASAQILNYEQRFSSLANIHEILLSNLIRTDFDCREAYETANEFFGTESVRFAGIDGTMYSRPLFDLVIFFGGAYASTGTVTFQRNAKPQVRYDERTLQNAAGISSVIPIYVNEVPDIDQTFFEAEQPDEINPDQLLTDEAIIDNTTIANWIMTFAEYYLAYKLATDSRPDTRIILLDRSLSIERASLIYDTGKRDLWKARSSIIGYKIDNELITPNDITIARQLLHNQRLGVPPPRGDYLNYAIIQSLKDNGSQSEEQIQAALALTDEKRSRRAKRYLKRLTNEGIISEQDGTYTLNQQFLCTLERIKKLTTSLGDHFFVEKTQDNTTGNTMKITKDGKEHWLTTIDISFLILFTLQMLMEECWKKHILLIGITKDTAARDFKRQLIPIMQSQQLLKTHIPKDTFENLPNTDRMILQSASIFNPEQIKPPWTLIEYDSAFRTMIPDRKNRVGYVSGAIKNRISLERTFLKTYIQLSQAKSDPMLRSNVLLTDRLAYPEYDIRPETTTKFLTEFGAAEEPVEVILYKDKTMTNSLQNLVMNLLIAMAPSSIPEAFGHNKPLFIADKLAKWNYAQFKRVVDTTADWLLNNHKLRRFVFYMSTFRERRASIEAARRE